MKTDPLALCLALVAACFLPGCGTREALVVGMEATLTDGFAAACDGEAACVASVSTHAATCFDRDLAEDAIEAEPAAKTAINTRHILRMQACLATESGKDHWAGRDMPRTILGDD